ncbi:MAG: zf-TFIIB domain-containing protein [Nitrospira sp.]|nr:zf-TFIIB domain-containing protein [bacterium]MBL7048678.1 zf-TFIIB domain-containing protein [Nitrospira sp.]
MNEKNNVKQCTCCQKAINETYDTCPLCGGTQTSEYLFAAEECPKCKSELKIEIVDGEEYDICTTCGGMWLDRDEFHRATSQCNIYKKLEIKRKFTRAPLVEDIEYVSCLRCGKLMNRHNFGTISGVIIDKCSKHGVWLDAGELKKIQYFIADGGLDRSRDRDIEANRAQIKDIASQVDSIDFTQKILHFWNFKRWLFRG